MPRRPLSRLAGALLAVALGVALGIALLTQHSPSTAAVGEPRPAGAPLPVAAAAPAIPPPAESPPPETAREDAPATVEEVPPPLPSTGLLDGVPLAEDERPARAAELPVAVMIDNIASARPQTGLDRAEVVYEALVEFGITRLMAVYWRNDAPVIGPVRSARTQYLGMVSELDAVYVHIGAAADDGPADAADQMREWGLRAIDENGTGIITRDRARPAPHNAYTSTAAVRGYARAAGWAGPAALAPWPFKDDGGADGAQTVVVSMDFDITRTHGGAFAVRWEYDAATNSYRRFQAGAPHVDARSGQQLRAKNVIVHVARVRTGVDRDGHVLYDAEGTGRAVILLDGVALEATWRKDDRTGRTHYFDGSGREIALNRGATWVEMLPAGQPLTLR